MPETIVLSLGGSLIVPEDIDVNYLKKFKSLIDSYTAKGFKFVIVTGGGKTCRKYQGALTKIMGQDNEASDWLGISSTHLNAQLIKSLFHKDVHPEVIKDPTSVINFKEKILVAGGWKPGFSSDMDAVVLATNVGAKKVINLTNVDYVCDKDPNKFDDANKIENLSWDDFKDLIGDKWVPGMNVPFDPIAAKEAKAHNLIVYIANGRKLANLEKIFLGDNYKCTTIQ